MRFIAKYGSYAVQVQHEIAEPFATGQVRLLQKSIVAQFQPWGMKPLERELAIAHWGNNWNGFYQEQDEVTVVPPDYRIGVFDSEEAQVEHNWSDEERELVERTLIENGQITDNVIAIPLTVVPAPWPRYDDYNGSTDELLRKLVQDGHELADVLEYERAHLKREDVIAGLNGLIADPDALPELQPDVEEIAG